MKIVITSGGTSEKIDSVRRIINTSTGKLGSLIAEEFYKTDSNIEIIYLCSNSAALPNVPCTIVKIDSANEIKNYLENLLKTETIDAVIHSMAISDYHVSKISDLDEIIIHISTKLQENKAILESCTDTYDLIKSEITEGCTKMGTEKKIGSNIPELAIFMKRNPKIISIIKNLQPKTILVGFKLLVNVPEKELFEVANNLLKANNCDFVLANDLNNITADEHRGTLISADSSSTSLRTKEEIAEAIVRNVLIKLRGE